MAKKENYYIQNGTIGYQWLGLFPYPKDAINFFKRCMMIAGDNKSYYLITERDQILAKGKGVPTGTTWLLSPELLGITCMKPGDRW